MTHTAHELAEYLSCTLEGDGSVPLSGVASPDSAGYADVIYVENQRHLDRAGLKMLGRHTVHAHRVEEKNVSQHFVFGLVASRIFAMWKGRE